jgi:predicted ribosome quality control (RQC) complex YloA/Tae2 family protein
MTLLDLRAAVTELRAKLTGLRLANVYDVNSRTYLLKFSQPGKKFVLVLESGTRVHTTQFTRDKSTIPSGFAMKVRQSKLWLQLQSC